MKRTLFGLYNYNYDNRHHRYYDENNYSWFFKLLSIPIYKENDNRLHLEDVYMHFYDRLAISDIWNSDNHDNLIFDFYKSNMETLITKDRRKEGDVPDKIRFWNYSYGMLGNPQEYRYVNTLCGDICKCIDGCIKELEKKGTLKECYISPFNLLIQNLNNHEDPISIQSSILAELIFGKKNINNSSVDAISESNPQSIKKSKIFTESLILCLLFGTIDADGNWEYLQKYIKRRIWGEDTIDFTIIQENRTMFDSRKCGYGVIDSKCKGRYILNSPGGAGKSYALEYLGAYVNGAEYVNLNEKTLKDKYKLDRKNKSHPQSHIKDIESKFIFLDSLNEIMNNQALYDYICDDINDLPSDKTIIVASRYGTEVHCTLRGFEECSLVVDIDKDKADKLVDYLSFKNGLENLLEYPLFYKLAASIYNNDKNNREIE